MNLDAGYAQELFATPVAKSITIGDLYMIYMDSPGTHPDRQCILRHAGAFLVEEEEGGSPGDVGGLMAM
eukprot:15217232-Alexandrium_andersonii.AAC.1